MLGRAAPALSPASRLSSHNKGSGRGREAGGRRPRQGLDGRAGHGRLPGHTAALLPGVPREGGAAWQWQRVPPPAPALPGGTELSVPPHAATPTLRRGLGTREEEEGTVVAQGRAAAPQATPRTVGGKGEPGSTTLSTMVLSPLYDPGMLCPLPSKTSAAPQTATAEGHRLLLALLPPATATAGETRTPRSWELPCPVQPGSAGRGAGRQGLNHPPQLHVAKGNLKCQSHQPQYVRAPAKRSSAEAALVQPVPAPLPPSRRCGQHPPTVPSATSCPQAQPCGEGPGPGARARWEPGRRDNTPPGTRGRQSHQSVKCQDAGGIGNCPSWET